MSQSDISSFLIASRNEDLRRVLKKKTAKGSSEKEISGDESHHEIKLNKKSWKEDTGEEDGPKAKISKKVTAKAKRGNKDISRENTIKEVIPKQSLSIYKKKSRDKKNLSKEILEENVSNDEDPKEENEIPATLEQSSDKTPLMWACQNHDLEEVRRLLREHADDTVQTTLGETALILAIPKISQRLSKNIRKILKLLCRNPVNWSHQYRNRNALAHAVHESETQVIEHLLTLNPPRRAQQEALIHAFFYRVRNMDPLLDFDKTLARKTPLEFFEKIRCQAKAEEPGCTTNEEQYDRACRLFLVKLTYQRQLEKTIRDLTDVCVWSLNGCLEPTICLSGQNLPVDF